MQRGAFNTSMKKGLGGAMVVIDEDAATDMYGGGRRGAKKLVKTFLFSASIKFTQIQQKIHSLII